tara:strand:+ start:272 stop:514 length:243 start_codon:yes stop_codon:yes gene_type:complete
MVNRHVSRVGASILTNIGLTNFITYDSDTYIRKAVETASNLDYLQTLRRELREKMLASKICDANSFAKDIENAYIEIFHT